jgi:hypothetical protein
MMFVDNYNRRIVILNDDGILDKVITCSLGDPFDVTSLDDTTVAVSTNNCIDIIIICACLSFVVLIATDGGLVSIDTDPNVVIVDNISCIFVLMLYLMLSCSEIRQQRQMFQDQIKQMRVKINSHLDTIEQNILQELDDTDNQCRCFGCFNYFTYRQKPNTIFVVCRNTIWTARFVMLLTEICIFHFMIFTMITDF